MELKSTLKYSLSAIFFLTLILFSLIYVPNTKKDALFITPPAELKHFHFGYREAIADSFWLRTLQDIDYCNKKKENNFCEDNSWLGSMYRLIIDFSPKYLPVYRVGGIALSLLIRDIESASFIYDKGVEQFPNDWVLLYRAAYHAATNENNPEKAASLLKRAADISPVTQVQWLYALAARLYTEAGRKELGRQVYEQLKKENVDPETLKRVQQNLGIEGN